MTTAGLLDHSHIKACRADIPYVKILCNKPNQTWEVQTSIEII